MSSQLDPGQIIKRAFDEESDSIKVAFDGGVSIGSVDISGYSDAEFVRRDYSSSSVSTSAYSTLIASTAHAYQEIEIFDSSGQTLKIAFGASSSEVDKFLVIPGGNGRVAHAVPLGTRISIRAVSGTATSGEIIMNLRG